MFCGETGEVEVTDEQKEAIENRYNTGDLIQDIAPSLSAGDREMIISGTHDECFKVMFPKDEEND
jgi:hypothetical protein